MDIHFSNIKNLREKILPLNTFQPISHKHLQNTEETNKQTNILQHNRKVSS